MGLHAKRKVTAFNRYGALFLPCASDMGRRKSSDCGELSWRFHRKCHSKHMVDRLNPQPGRLRQNDVPLASFFNSHA